MDCVELVITAIEKYQSNYEVSRPRNAERDVVAAPRTGAAWPTRGGRCGDGQPSCGQCGLSCRCSAGLASQPAPCLFLRARARPCAARGRQGRARPASLPRPAPARADARRASAPLCPLPASSAQSACRLVKETMDKKYGEYWCVLIGGGFGFEVTHEVKHVLWLYFGGQLSVLVFKAGARQTGAK